MGFRVWGVGCRAKSVGFRVQGVGCRVWGAGFRVQGAGCRVAWPMSFWMKPATRSGRLSPAPKVISRVGTATPAVLGLGFEVLGLGFR